MRQVSIAIGLLWLLVGALWLFSRDDIGAVSTDEPLVVYCAAGVAPEVAAVAMEYEARFHQPIRLELGGSGTLLTRLRVRGEGDLFVAGDVSYIRRAQEAGVVREALTIAQMQPVLAVAAGNPLGIRSLRDLARDDVKYTLASPEAAAIGRCFRDRALTLGLWDGLKANAHTFKPTVEDVANDVALGVVDAGVVWTPVARRNAKLSLVPIVGFGASAQTVAVGVLEATARSAQSLQFARFLSGTNTGLPSFKAVGYSVSGGDEFVESPAVLLFCGAMLRVGVDETIRAFEKREGVRVERVYNGCGILVAQMVAGARPDAYITCDRSFMAQVQELFGEERELTSNGIVIAVKRGNPHGVRELSDLGLADLKIGLGHPTQSALGALTDRLIASLPARAEILENRELESATGDLLVSQMRAGHLDAVVVYRSNVLSHAGNAAELDVIPIQMEAALAHQTYATARSSSQPLIVERLLAEIASAESREPFESLGFNFLGGTR